MFFAFGRGGEAWGRGVRKVKNTFSAFKMYNVDCLHGQTNFFQTKYCTCTVRNVAFHKNI